jgi:hypothetical protein
MKIGPNIMTKESTMRTISTDTPCAGITFGQPLTTVAMEPCRSLGEWYYGQSCRQLAELRIEERRRRLARDPGFDEDSKTESEALRHDLVCDGVA